MKKRRLSTGIALMLTSALLTCCGQLCWKLAAAGPGIYLLAGFGLYGLGAILMMAAMRCGELSVLHPMLGAGYALSVVLGALALDETVSANKLLGIAVITGGLVCLGFSEGGNRK